MIARFYPYLAIAFVLPLVQLGIYFRRKENPVHRYCWATAGVLGAGLVAWVVFRGDIHSDQWVRTLLLQ